MPGLHPDAPPPALRVDPIVEAGAAEAFVLARARLAGLAPDRWAAFLRAWETPDLERGIMGARNPRGTLLGLASWWRQPDPQRGRALWADVIAVREIGVRPLVRDALLRALETMARARGDRLRIAVDGDDPRRPCTGTRAND